MTTRYWMGSTPNQCDLCDTPITDEFADAMVPRARRWGFMCPACIKTEQAQFGTGRGQHYRKDDAGRFAKVAG